MTISKRRGDSITCYLQSFEYRGPRRAIYILSYVYQGTGLTAFKYMATASYTIGPFDTWEWINLDNRLQLSPTGQPINLGHAYAAVIIALDPDWYNKLITRIYPNEVYFHA